MDALTGSIWTSLPCRSGLASRSGFASGSGLASRSGLAHVRLRTDKS